MPPEAPNEMEQLLRRYTKKRREEAGDFSLHPATRRMLQGEVARTFGTSERNRSSWGWLVAWRGLALGLSIVLVLGVGLALLWQHRNGSNRRGREILAKLEQPQSGAVTHHETKLKSESSRTPAAVRGESGNLEREMVAITPAPGSAPAVRGGALEAGKPMTGQEPSGPGAAGALDQLTKKTEPGPQENRVSLGATLKQQDTAGAANQPADRAAQATSSSPVQEQRDGNRARAFYSMADGRASLDRDQQQAAKAAREKMAQRQLQPPAASSGTERVTTVAGLNENGAQTQLDLTAAAPAKKDNAQTAVRMAPTAGSRVGKLDTYSRSTRRTEEKPAPLLSRFQVQQTGTTVRLTDSDGSIYEGNVLPDTAGTDPTISAGVQVDGAAPQPLVRFRVVGTNRTLQQPVAVTGRMQRLTSVGTVGFALQDPATNAELKEVERGVAAQLVPAAPAIPSTAPIGRARQSGALGGAAAPNTNAAVIEGTLQIGQSAERRFKAVQTTP